MPSARLLVAVAALYVDVVFRIGIVIAFGLDHAVLTIVVAVVARLLLVLGYCLLLRRLISPAPAVSRAPESH